MDSSVINITYCGCYITGTPNRVRREGRGSLFTSQTSSVTEAASDEIDIDIDEPQRVTS
jgi:hypothetical protein